MKLCPDCYDKYGSFKNMNIATEEECEIHRIQNNIPAYIKKIAERIRDIEFDTFVIGVTLKDKLLSTNPEKIQAIKKLIARPIGEYIEKTMKKKVDFKNPQITIYINTINDKIKLKISPLYIFGTYNKYVRNIPQTKWPCRNCRGKGCEKCNYTGKQYPTSVEELIAKDFVDAAQAKDESFHGAGREDIDARMLGEGRPFILEIKEPKKRHLDLKLIEKKINEENKGVIAVHKLKYADKKDIIRLKETKYDKTYRAEIECDVALKEKDIANINAIKNIQISQYTPQRVEHRRAKKTRKRTVYYAKVLETKNKKATIEIKAESGTYIKEFISGDDGRTLPSISNIIHKKCICTKLDVIKIWWQHDI